MLTQQHPKARKVGSEQVLQGSEMAVYVDLSQYWTDPKNPTIEEAKRKTGLDKRTLSAARKGQLERSQFETLFALRDFASELAGKPLSLEEIFKETPSSATPGGRPQEEFLPPSATPGGKPIEEFLPPSATPGGKPIEEFLPPSATPGGKPIEEFLPPSATPGGKPIEEFLPPSATPDEKRRKK